MTILKLRLCGASKHAVCYVFLLCADRKARGTKQVTSYMNMFSTCVGKAWEEALPMCGLTALGTTGLKPSAYLCPSPIEICQNVLCK